MVACTLFGKYCIITVKRSWWGNEATEKAVREKEDRLKMWKRTGEDDDRNEYKRAKVLQRKWLRW